MDFSAGQTSRSIYAKLPDPSSYIRLLHVEAGDDEAVISCSLEVVPLSSKPQYSALSYTWGDAGDTRNIIIGGRAVEVRFNCFYALWQLRHFGKRNLTPYWIDFLCINQDDPEEKAPQVQMMCKIYADADEVCVSLGASTEDSDLLFQMVNEYPETGYNLNAGLRHLQEVAQDGGIMPLLRARTATQQLERQPYWRRLWIVQEFLSGREVSIMCGTSLVGWRALHDLIPSLYSYLETHMNSEERRSSDSTRYETLDMWTILDYRNSVRPGEKTYLSQAVRYFGYYGCMNKLDHIYGLLGLLEDLDQLAMPLIVNYSTTSFDLARQCIPLLAKELGLIEDVAQLLRALDVGPSHSEVRRLITQRCHPVSVTDLYNLAHTGPVHCDAPARTNGMRRIRSTSDRFGPFLPRNKIGIWRFML